MLCSHFAQPPSSFPGSVGSPEQLEVMQISVSACNTLGSKDSTHQKVYDVLDNQIPSTRSPLCDLQEALNSWKSGKAQILVATDVAARGLHIKNLPYVINYDFPSNLDTYTHRVGRTGRLATDGHAYSFLTRNLAPLAKPLLDLLKVRVILPFGFKLIEII